MQLQYLFHNFKFFIKAEQIYMFLVQKSDNFLVLRNANAESDITRCVVGRERVCVCVCEREREMGLPEMCKCV